MTPIEKLKAEIAELEKQYQPYADRQARYVGSGEDAMTDPDVEAAHREGAPLLKQIEDKYAELRHLEKA